MPGCMKCGKIKPDNKFYTYRSGDKVEMCKDCLTMHVDNFDPETYLWILEKMDVPYIEGEWNAIREKEFAKDPAKMNGMSVIGRYLSKMKLKQHKDYRWADTERLRIESLQKDELQKQQWKEFEDEIKKKYENGEITEAEYKTMVSARTQNEEYQGKIITGTVLPEQVNNFSYNSEAKDIVNEEFNNLTDDLTEEDKKYLAMKWGVFYKTNEWIELERMYKEMTDSFDIQDADTVNTLILICKTNLKMNTCLDTGDLDGFQKLSKVSESLRKSSKFTAAQNKEKEGEGVNSIGELVAFCEREEGAIPRFIIDTPLDIVDKIIIDLKEYTKNLIYDDKSLAQLIERYINKKERAETKNKEQQLQTEDYLDYADELTKLKKEDEKLYKGE